MKSLQLRFFVVVWLFVVTTMVLLASLLGRWSLLELQRVSVETRVDRRIDSLSQRMVDSLGVIPVGDSVAMSAVLRRYSAGDSTAAGAAVLGADGRVLGSSVPDLPPGALTLRPDGTVMFTHSMTSGETTQRVVLGLPGRQFGRGADRRVLVVIPVLKSASARLRPPGTDPFHNLTRRIILAVAIGSLLSALVTALIARPLLGRVGELSRATAALRAGELRTRVAVRGNDEIARLAEAFNSMASELEASEEQRKRMVTDVAHELRTPLTNIIGLLEATRDGLQPLDAGVVAALHEEAWLLNQLVDDLRDLALADAGELPLTIEPLDAGEVARRTAAAFPVLPHEAVIVVELAAAGLLVRADRRRLGQILRNLLQNARRHSPGDGTITLRVERVGQQTRFLVADQGHGIPKAHQPHVFERFYRVDPSRDKATGGMGLGLALVLRLAEAQGGTVGLESEEGAGARFWVALPAG